MTELHQTDAIWGAMRARRHPETATADGFARMLAHCLEQGIAWIDHADIYDDGAVETLHGHAAARLDKQARSALRLITKCGVRFASPGQPGVRLHHYRSDADYIQASAEASLKRLGTDRIDLFLLHRPDYLMQVEETARALEALVASGKVAACGVSNFSAAQVAALARGGGPALAGNQIELSPLASSALDSGILEEARHRGMAVMAWSPLGGARLFDESDPCGGAVRAAAARIGGPGADPAGVILAWLRAIDVIPVLGTARPDRLTGQVETMRTVRLDPEDWYEILEAGRGARVP